MAGNGFDIKYKDIHDLLWEFNNKLTHLISALDNTQTAINSLVTNSTLEGEAATAIKAYFSDVHGTMISSLKVTAQSLLDNIALYKAGFYEIDPSTNFRLPEEVITEYKTTLYGKLVDINAAANYQAKTGGAVKLVEAALNDLSQKNLYSPAFPTSEYTSVETNHDAINTFLKNLIQNVTGLEENTVTVLENTTDVLITQLNAVNAKIGVDWGTIEKYEPSTAYTDGDMYALAYASQVVYEQHEQFSEIYDQIWEAEGELQKIADDRQEAGIWEIVGGVAFVVVGTVCIIATAGAASPVVAGIGITAGGGTCLFGVVDAAEGGQEYYYGSIGDIDSTSINVIRSAIYACGGDDKTYSLIEQTFAFAASAMIPIGAASNAGMLTFRSGIVTVGKEAVSTVAGMGAAKFTYDATGSRGLSMLAGMATSMGTGKGLSAADMTFGWSYGIKAADLKNLSYTDFSKYDLAQKNYAIKNMSGEDLMSMLADSKETSWIVKDYTLITAENVNDILIIRSDGTINLDWPKYGGLEVKSIGSIEDLNGKMNVSRSGSDGGRTIGFDEPGELSTCSQRSIPTGETTIQTGVMDVDMYKDVIDAIKNGPDDITRLSNLTNMGIDTDTAANLIREYYEWAGRVEISGVDGIQSGLAENNMNVNDIYGYYGNAAPWKTGNIVMEGGAGQMNIVFSWGAMKESGIVSNVGSVKIN